MTAETAEEVNRVYRWLEHSFELLDEKAAIDRPKLFQDAIIIVKVLKF